MTTFDTPTASSSLPNPHTKDRRITDLKQRWQQVADVNGQELAGRSGARLRATRIALGLSLGDLEVITDGELRASTVGSWERQDRWYGDVDQLARLCALYGISLGWLFADTTEMEATLRGSVSRSLHAFADAIAIADAEIDRADDTTETAAGNTPEPEPYDGPMIGAPDQ